MNPHTFAWIYTAVGVGVEVGYFVVRWFLQAYDEAKRAGAIRTEHPDL